MAPGHLSSVAEPVATVAQHQHPNLCATSVPKTLSRREARQAHRRSDASEGLAAANAWLAKTCCEALLREDSHHRALRPCGAGALPSAEVAWGTRA